MLCPWPLLTVLVTASLATSAPLARRGGSTDQSQQVSGASDGSIHPISVDGSQQIVNTFSKPPEIPSAVNNAPDPVGLAWVLGHMGGQGQGAGDGPSDASSSPSPVNNRREVPPIGAMIGPLMDGLGMAGMMGGMGGGGGGGGGGGSTDQSQQSSGNADDSYHPISVNSGQHVQNNFRRRPLGFGTLGKTSSAPPPPPSSSAPPPPPSSSAAPPPPSSTPPAPSSSSPAPSSTASPDGQSKSQGGGDNDDDGGSGSGGAGPSIDAGGHANVSVSDSGNDHSKNAKGVGGMSNVTAGNITTHTTVEQGTEERTCYLPTYEDNYFGGGNQTSGIHGVSHVPLTVDGTHIPITSNNEGVDKNQQQNGQGQGNNNGQQHKKNGGQQNGNGGQNGGGGGGGGNGNGQNNRRAVFARGGGGGGGDCSNCVCNCYCSPNRRSLDATPSSLFSLHERRGGAKKVTTPANCAVVKSQGGLVYSGDQCHLKGQPAKVSG